VCHLISCIPLGHGSSDGSGSFSNFPSWSLPTDLFSKIQVIYSHFLPLYLQKPVLGFLGLIRSRVCHQSFSKTQIMVNRHMRRSNKVSKSNFSIITCSVIDFSSKPYFEEKQSFFFYVYKISCNFILPICNKSGNAALVTFSSSCTPTPTKE